MKGFSQSDHTQTLACSEPSGAHKPFESLPILFRLHIWSNKSLPVNMSVGCHGAPLKQLDLWCSFFSMRGSHYTCTPDLPLTACREP
nr:hypothetical protein Q903MT_gene6047 [Picea sitchensis]